jgi:hypothetical protein
VSALRLFEFESDDSPMLNDVQIKWLDTKLREVQLVLRVRGYVEESEEKTEIVTGVEAGPQWKPFEHYERAERAEQSTRVEEFVKLI